MFRDKNLGVEYNFFLPRDKFKDIVVPRGSDVIQSDAHPVPDSPLFHNPYDKDRPSWNPHKDTPAYLHQSAVGHNSRGSSSFIGPHTSFEYGNSKPKPTNNRGDYDDKVTNDEQESHEDVYLKRWLKAFSPEGSNHRRDPTKPYISATPWPDPSKNAGHNVDVFTPPSQTVAPPRHQRTPSPLEGVQGGNWGHDVHSFRDNHGKASHGRRPHPGNPIKDGKEAAGSVPTKILQYNRLVEVPEFFKFKKPKYCGQCDRRKRMNKEFCKHSFGKKF